MFKFINSTIFFNYLLIGNLSMDILQDILYIKSSIIISIIGIIVLLSSIVLGKSVFDLVFFSGKGQKILDTGAKVIAIVAGSTVIGTNGPPLVKSARKSIEEMMKQDKEQSDGSNSNKSNPTNTSNNSSNSSSESSSKTNNNSSESSSKNNK